MKVKVRHIRQHRLTNSIGGEEITTLHTHTHMHIVHTYLVYMIRNPKKIDPSKTGIKFKGEGWTLESVQSVYHEKREKKNRDILEKQG